LKKVLEWKPARGIRKASLAAMNAVHIKCCRVHQRSSPSIRLCSNFRSRDPVLGPRSPRRWSMGLSPGLHRSPDFGFSQEFAEYRAYSRATILRHVDWNVFARTDRCYLKRYRGETNTQLLVLLDTSASMGYGSHTPCTSWTTRFLAASLCYMANCAARRGRSDRFRRRRHQLRGAVHASGPDLIPPAARHRKGAGGTRTDFTKPFVHFQNFLHRRGMVVVISDFYEDPRQIVKTVEPLRFKGNEVILFHILDPQEIAPKFREPVLLVDMENGRRWKSRRNTRATNTGPEDRRAHRGAALQGARRGLEYVPGGYQQPAR
jgi:uncharacterized protein (DUF58 family)